MRLRHRVFAVLILLGWFIAGGHVCLYHGGTADGGAMHAQGGHHDDHDDHDDHDGDAPEHDGHHHHDLTPFASGQSTKTTGLEVLAPVWVPLSDTLVARLTARLTALAREAYDARRTLDFVEPPTDARASGWLFVAQTAHPVRGPSLV